LALIHHFFVLAPCYSTGLPGKPVIPTLEKVLSHPSARCLLIERVPPLSHPHFSNFGNYISFAFVSDVSAGSVFSFLGNPHCRGFLIFLSPLFSPPPPPPPPPPHPQFFALDVPALHPCFGIILVVFFFSAGFSPYPVYPTHRILVTPHERLSPALASVPFVFNGRFFYSLAPVPFFGVSPDFLPPSPPPLWTAVADFRFNPNFSVFEQCCLPRIFSVFSTLGCLRLVVLSPPHCNKGSFFVEANPRLETPHETIS